MFALRTGSIYGVPTGDSRVSDHAAVRWRLGPARAIGRARKGAAAMSHDAQQGPPPRDAYGAKWASHVESPTRQRIRSEVYADEYPADVDPRSYLTWTELRRLARELRLGRGDTFVDLGCGQGGPCLWVARETGASVVGLDLAEAAIARARERAQVLGVADRARFE